VQLGWQFRRLGRRPLLPAGETGPLEGWCEVPSLQLGRLHFAEPGLRGFGERLVVVRLSSTFVSPTTLALESLNPSVAQVASAYLLLQRFAAEVALFASEVATFAAASTLLKIRQIPARRPVVVEEAEPVVR